jgi:hypothetical protein
MQWAGEPKLEEVLSDPIVRAVMASDGVDPEGLRVLLRNATKSLALLSGDATDGNAAGKTPDGYLTHSAPARPLATNC